MWRGRESKSIFLSLKEHKVGWLGNGKDLEGCGQKIKCEKYIAWKDNLKQQNKSLLNLKISLSVIIIRTINKVLGQNKNINLKIRTIA